MTMSEFYSSLYFSVFSKFPEVSDYISNNLNLTMVKIIIDLHIHGGKKTS